MNKDKLKKIAKEIYPYLIVVLVVVLIRSFIVTPAIVNGKSMKPNLSNNDIVIVNKLDYKLNGVKRFDIVILKYKDEKLIKRIIGLPGDKIEYKKDELYVNGFLVKENFKHESTADFKLESIGYLSIPGDKYFVVGDNRPASNDSRIQVGLVDKKDIIGKVNYRIFPFSKISKLK